MGPLLLETSSSSSTGKPTYWLKLVVANDYIRYEEKGPNTHHAAVAIVAAANELFNTLCNTLPFSIKIQIIKMVTFSTADPVRFLMCAVLRE